MIKIYDNLNLRNFWSKYWQNVSEECDFIVNYEYYPFNLLKNYLKKDHLILEAGCGTGRVLKGLHNEGYRIIGFDYDIGALRIMNKVNQYSLFLGDIMNMPLKKETFDTVLCFGVVTCIEEIEAINKSLKEINFVLKSDGILIISLLNYNLSRRLHRLLGAVRGILGGRHFHCWADSLGNLEIFLSKEFKIIERAPSISRQPYYEMLSFFRSSEQIDRKLARVSDTEYKLNYFGESVFNISKKLFPYAISGSTTFVCSKR